MRTGKAISRAFVTAIGLFVASSAFAAEDGVWVVRKFSGEVWTTNGDVQQISLNTEDVLKSGNTIRTGRNGRVLLVRGEESILIAPNSVVGLPSEKKEGLATTIKQQAGSILLEVEKKNVKHFEVDTPYLAAVVKGTQFRVTVTAAGAKVEVVRGQVEVADFKTGQVAQVMPGQHAIASSSGNAGLTLGGSGMLHPIQPGQPRASSVDRVPVPRNGFTAPGKSGLASLQRQASTGARPGVVRISSALGEIRVNVNRVTNGLARNASAEAGARNALNRETATVWNSSGSGGPNNGNANGNGGNGNSNSNSNGGTAAGNSSGNSGNGVGSGASAVAGLVGGGVGSVVGGVGGVVGRAGGAAGGLVRGR